MQTSALIIHCLLIFFLVYGLLMVVVPEKVNQAVKEVYRFAHLLPRKTIEKPIRNKDLLPNRIVGGLYLALCIITLLNMRFQLGRIGGEATPVWTSPGEEIHDLEFHQRIRDIVQPAMSRHVGLAVATIINDKRDISGFGRIDLSSEQAPDGDTVFEIGSVSKVFTGILLAEMIERGHWTLDTSLKPLLPEIRNESDARVDGITVSHLATHTSGLPRMPARSLSISRMWRFIIAADSYHDYTDDDILAIISEKRLRRAPGERHAYSNVGFGALGLALSRQAAADYHQMVETAVALPLGLKDTGVAIDQAQRSRLATGYRLYHHVGPFYLAQLAEPWEFPNSMAAAGGLRSTANDMSIFLAANMGRGDSAVTPILRRSHEILFDEGDTRIGMGWRHSILPKSQRTYIWHNGGTGGFSSFLGFTDDRVIGVVILGNSTRKVDDIGLEILETLHPEA
jgi:CubicO group peptidase (beta-lactamase class C family)